MQPPLIDPNHEPIRTADQIAFHRSRSAHLDITCRAQVPVARSATEWGLGSVVTARPRDIARAKARAEKLPTRIAMREAAVSAES